MLKSAEFKQPNTEQRKQMPFIRLNLNKSNKDDISKLKELGWTVGQGSGAGELPFIWEADGEPQLPDDMAEKIIGDKKGIIEYRD